MASGCFLHIRSRWNLACMGSSRGSSEGPSSPPPCPLPPLPWCCRGCAGPPPNQGKTASRRHSLPGLVLFTPPLTLKPVGSASVTGRRPPPRWPDSVSDLGLSRPRPQTGSEQLPHLKRCLGRSGVHLSTLQLSPVGPLWTPGPLPAFPTSLRLVWLPSSCLSMHEVAGAGTRGVGVRMAVGWAPLTSCSGVGCLPSGRRSPRGGISAAQRRCLPTPLPRGPAPALNRGAAPKPRSPVPVQRNVLRALCTGPRPTVSAPTPLAWSPPYAC